MSTRIRCTVNGKPAELTGDPMDRLLDALRETLKLTGTKEGCGEGECGACTVLLDGEPVCACLVPIIQVEGREIVTIEGVEKNGQLDPLQEAFVTEGGAQCGACTPGMILTARALIDRVPEPDRAVIREALAGTLCRCTGYERIFRSIESVTRCDAGAPSEEESS